MVFDVEILNLVLYCVQQLGIALGLGAQTVMLVAYLLASRDNVVDATEAQFLRATRRVLAVSLVLIVASGVGITALHAIGGQVAVIMSPAYLFKFALIVLVVVVTSLIHVLPETFAEGFVGGNWYALFLVHILAPVASWGSLITMWLVWLAGFMICWYAIVFSTREKNVGAKVLIQPNGLKTVKPASKPLFSFLSRKPDDADQASAAHATEIKQDMKEQVKEQLQPIILDNKPKPPTLVPEALKPVEVKLPIQPTAPLQQIRTDAPPVIMKGATPVEVSPANKTTDTPFLPQVPPLQPIPTISAVPGSPPPIAILPQVQGAGIPTPPGQHEAPLLQKPENLPSANPTISPEIKLGLNVMPKSPDQLQK